MSAQPREAPNSWPRGKLCSEGGLKAREDTVLKTLLYDIAYLKQLESPGRLAPKSWTITQKGLCVESELEVSVRN